MRYMVVITQANLDQIDQVCGGLGFEIRLDTFASRPDLLALRKRTTAPLLATYRSKTHCGEADPADRPTIGWEWRLAALRAGFDGVDLEMDEPFLGDRLREIHDLGGWSVLSHHEVKAGVNLLDRLKGSLKLNSEVIKIIGTGSRAADFQQQRKAYEIAGSRKLILFFMGDDFKATRLVSRLLGAPFTFVLPPGADQVAPGIPTLEECKSLYALDSVVDHGAFWFGVVGKPIGHSKSPGFHNPLLKAMDPGALFLPFPVAKSELEPFLECFPNMLGLAVTKPLKEEAFALANRFVDQAVAGLGAVNTLLRDGDDWVGGNTDYAAMKAILSEVPAGSLVRVVGYGGLGKAVVLACLELGLQVEVTNRSENRLAGLDPRVRVVPWAERHRSGVQVLVQATSVGMAPELDRTPLSTIPQGVALLVETIYNPEETKLMTMAKQQGIPVVDGLALFNKQAAIQNGYFQQVLKKSLNRHA